MLLGFAKGLARIRVTIAYAAILIGVSTGLALLMDAIGARQYAFTVLFPASITLTTMLYCSFYATYRGCYGVQEPSRADAPGAPTA